VDLLLVLLLTSLRDHTVPRSAACTHSTPSIPWAGRQLATRLPLLAHTLYRVNAAHHTTTPCQQANIIWTRGSIHSLPHSPLYLPCSAPIWTSMADARGASPTCRAMGQNSGADLDAGSSREHSRYMTPLARQARGSAWNLYLLCRAWRRMRIAGALPGWPIHKLAAPPAGLTRTRTPLCPGLRLAYAAAAPAKRRQAPSAANGLCLLTAHLRYRRIPMPSPCLSRWHSSFNATRLCTY